MPTVFVDVRQIVEELGLYGSRWGVHRAVKKKEIPPGKLYGRRMLWLRSDLVQPAAPVPRVIKRRKP